MLVYWMKRDEPTVNECTICVVCRSKCSRLTPRNWLWAMLPLRVIALRRSRKSVSANRCRRFNWCSDGKLPRPFSVANLWLIVLLLLQPPPFKRRGNEYVLILLQRWNSVNAQTSTQWDFIFGQLLSATYTRREPQTRIYSIVVLATETNNEWSVPFHHFHSHSFTQNILHEAFWNNFHSNRR